EYARARQDKLARKPASLTFGQAAAVAVSGLTALQGLRDAGRLQPGQHVLITGASGGVGTFAVQIAKALGARVTGVCSTAKTGLVSSIGADHVLDYTPVIRGSKAKNWTLRRSCRGRRVRGGEAKSAATRGGSQMSATVG